MRILPKRAESLHRQRLSTGAAYMAHTGRMSQQLGRISSDIVEEIAFKLLAKPPRNMLNYASRLNIEDKEVFSMAKCNVCDKSVNFGRKISITRSQVSRRALSKQKPNIRRVRVLDEGTPKTMHVCSRCLRSGKVVRA